MGRIRTIKPEFPHSESMGRVSRDARLCFIMLWTIADDSGRLRGNSRMLASLLFPYDIDAPKHIDGWLDKLVEVKAIVRYNGKDGGSYIEICNWRSHQKIDKPSVSKLPAPDSSSIREASPNGSEGSRGFVGGSKDQGEDQGEDHSLCDPPQSAESLKSEFNFVTSGNGIWNLPKDKLDEWLSTFTGIDVESQLRTAAQWLKDNPANRKTDRGMTKFLGGWLTRAQNAPRSSQQPGLPFGQDLRRKPLEVRPERCFK